MNSTLVDPMSPHITIISLLRILLLNTLSIWPDRYTSVVVFIDADCPLLDEILELLNAEVRIPMTIYSFEGGGEVLQAARQYEEPNNLVVFAVRNGLWKLKLVQHSLFYSDHRLVVMMNSDDEDQHLIESVRENMSRFKSCLLLKPNGELWFYRSLKTEQIIRYQLDANRSESVIQILHSIYNWRREAIPKWNATVFVHYYPPVSMVAPNYNSDGRYIATEIVGVDTLTAYDIAERLNANARLVTDVETVVPGYDFDFNKSEEEKPSKLGQTLYVVAFYDRIKLDRPPFDYNWTYVKNIEMTNMYK